MWDLGDLWSEGLSAGALRNIWRLFLDDDEGSHPKNYFKHTNMQIKLIRRSMEEYLNPSLCRNVPNSRAVVTLFRGDWLLWISRTKPIRITEHTLRMNWVLQAAAAYVFKPTSLLNFPMRWSGGCCSWPHRDVPYTEELISRPFDKLCGWIDSA